MRLQLLPLGLILILALVGSSCNSPSAVSSNQTRVSKRTEALQDQVYSLRQILYDMHVAVTAEPSGDVSDGLFLGRIVQIEASTPTPSFVIDFVSAEMMPGVSKQQRERSSWPDYFGWNKIKHPQRFQLNDSAELVTGGLRFLSVSPKGFIKGWRTYSSPKTINYYVAISNDEVIAVWPWLP